MAKRRRECSFIGERLREAAIRAASDKIKDANANARQFAEAYATAFGGDNE